MLLYCGSLNRLWFVELSEHKHINLNWNLSVINRLCRLQRLPKFFCKLLIFKWSNEKLLLSKWFKFREDSSGEKYCESLKLKVLKKDLTVRIQYYLEFARFEFFLPSISISLENHLMMLEWTRKSCQKKNLSKKSGLDPYKLQFIL